MKIIIYSLILVLTMAGCGFGVRESMIRNQRPEYLKSYKSGPIGALTQKDIDEAIEFGKNNKHNQKVIDYAFMTAKDSSRLLEVNPRTIYVLICTNYYLIADYAAKQTKNYESIDMDYVNFLAHLPTFQIEAVEQMGGITYPFQLNSKFVLFKNGNKVEESTENPLYKSSTPYVSSHLSGQSDWQATLNETVRKSTEMAAKIAQSYQKDMKIDTVIPAVKPQHTYDYKEIDLNSKYEVVIIYDDREVHVPIDIASIK